MLFPLSVYILNSNCESFQARDGVGNRPSKHTISNHSLQHSKWQCKKATAQKRRGKEKKDSQVKPR